MKRSGKSNRLAFTLIETLLALVFLVAASGFTLQIHQSRMDYDRRAMDRLKHQLAIENIAQQLSVVDYVDLPEQADELARQSGIEITVQQFEANAVSGWHVTFMTECKGSPLQQHQWFMEPTQ